MAYSTVMLFLLAILCVSHLAQGGYATEPSYEEDEYEESPAARWGAWSECTEACGTGRQRRVETCLDPREECPKVREQVRTCASTSQACADSALHEAVVVKSLPKGERTHRRHLFMYMTTLGVLTTTVVVLLLLIWYHMVRLSNNRGNGAKQTASITSLDRHTP